MRHRCKVDHLGKPADQREALIRSMLTSLFTHDEIKTTHVRAKALKKRADRIVTLAKRGDLHAIRQVRKLIYNSPTGEIWVNQKNQEISETVLRRIFKTLAPRFKGRKGGYTRVIQMPPRRGDGAPMALIQLTFELQEKTQQKQSHAITAHSEKHHHTHKTSDSGAVINETIDVQQQDTHSMEQETE